ncbi:MAG: hypothetical protein H6R09_913 [Proteobacteria bacterium]|nr:hypothetical protein [Pseudomonadota bacterium]
MALSMKSIAIIIAAGQLGCTAAWAASVSVVGLFKDKAIVSIDGGKPRTLSVGQAVQGVKLLTANSDSASFEVDGKRRTLGMGQSFAGGATTAGRQSVSLTADARGHFAAAGSLNGYPVSFKVGGISVNQVDGLVMETGLNVPLLGMSFLNRMDMKRDGQTMTLTQRY